MTLHPKAAGAGIGGALAVVILWALSYVVDVPPEVAGGFVAIIGTGCAWLAPWFAKHRPGDES